MAFPNKSYNDFYNEIKLNLVSRLGYNIFKNSIINIWNIVNATVFTSLHKSIQWTYLNYFISTSFDEDTIRLHANEKASITQKPASSASGKIVINGNVGIVIPTNTTFVSNGLEYKTLADATITNTQILITTLNRIGNVVYATTSINHNLASGILLSISGANEIDFNVVNKIIIVTGFNTFTFQEDGVQGLATGTINLTTNIALINIESNDGGVNTNLVSGSPLTILVPIVGINSTAFVDYSNVIGGADKETIDELQQRAIQIVKNPAPVFSGIYYKNLALSLSGIERAWCYDSPSSFDLSGIFEIFILPYNPSNISDLSTLLLTGQLHSSFFPELSGPNQNFFIKQPTLQPVNITITNILPNTLLMKQQIDNNFTTFFNNIELGQNINVETIKNVIRQTQDTNGIYAVFNDVTINNGTSARDVLLTKGTITYI